MSKVIAFVAALLIVVSPVSAGAVAQTRPEFPADVRVPRFEPAGRGRLVVALGDLQRARHIAVVVPGSDVDVRRFGSLLAMARAVHSAAGRDDVAVVAWLGYDTPEGLGIDAATGGLARAGAVELASFLRELPAAHVSVLCHSYGTVVCASADLSGVGDVVLTGSPGVRASSVAELRTGARVWAARSSGDWTGWVPKVRVGDLGHGADPVAPEFGARAFPAGDGSHDEYYRVGGVALAEIVRVVVGDAR
ncbi:alpha/beta hydrolase family protein [Umezawaea endophytica]|uniref:Alpha/beta hydrolase family protein n=1 Tax=Umezawaea endophytica TaxID=1654476 RepID=A0A9X2VRK8_9PSEU|nr:alpha/beta hydrolase family protein [Umezawaea endophytica]MCS7481585.1 alpha/beta hydrolase family protein [Umezawaea endophytica]